MHREFLAKVHALGNDDAAPDPQSALRAAVVEDLQPLRNALADVLQAKGERDAEAILRQLEEHWDTVTDQVLAGDSAEKALEAALGTAFVQGLDLTALATANIQH